MSSSDRRLVLHARVISGSWGGPDKTILNSPRFLRDRYEMLCAYMRDPGDPQFGALEELARQNDVSVVPIDDHGPLDRGIVARFRALCDEHSPAIWHGHDYKSNLVGLRVAKGRQMHLVTTVHGWVKRTWKTPLYYGLDRWSLKRYEHVVCVSEDLYERCMRSGVSPDRCSHIANGIDTERFKRSETAAEARRRLDLETDRVVVGAMGRLSAEKGFDLLIESLGQTNSNRDVELWIAGQGDWEPELRRRASRLGLADRVRFLGFRSDTVDLFEAMDVFVLSSLREGLPNVVLEAMAVEVPVVATSVAGVPGLIDHGRNGLLVEPGSSRGLAEALATLVDDEELRSQLAKAGRRTVESDYSFDVRMRAIGGIYDRVMSGES